MAKSRYALVLDVGTTGTKCFVFCEKQASASRRKTEIHILAKAYRTYPVQTPKRGWVEQDPVRMLKACERVMKEAVADSGVDPKRIESFGLTNQRETTILWDSKTMKPVYPAIVWEDARTAQRLKGMGHRASGIARAVRTKTGLTLDPYFSASKVEWILEHVPEAKHLTDVGRLRFGTVDAWLLANLCVGNPHETDETNASRTLLFNIRTRAWDEDLCALFHVPVRILPAVLPPRADFGTLRPEILGCPIPVCAVIGDQQSSMSAAIASARTNTASTTKVTYGTGTFVMQLLGNAFATQKGFFTTLVPVHGKTAYALEAKIRVSGPDVEKRLTHPKELETYLRDLARDVNRHLKRLPATPKEILIDGGITRSPLLAPIQHEVSGIRIRPLTTYDGTALGVAMMLFR
jgi:glycerol kinase